MYMREGIIEIDKRFVFDKDFFLIRHKLKNREDRNFVLLCIYLKNIGLTIIALTLAYGLIERIK